MESGAKGSSFGTHVAVSVVCKTGLAEGAPDNTRMSQIMIFGGHGKVALLASPLLFAKGHTVTAVIRNPEHAPEVERAGARALVADLERLSVPELTDLITGQDALVWSAGAGGGQPQRTYAVDRDAAIRSMDAALEAGVKRYVMVSYYGAGERHGVAFGDGFFPYADAKSAADSYLRGTSLEWTLLRPSRLTLGQANGQIDASAEVDASPEGAREVSRANVAAVIAAVLESPESTGLTLNFNDGNEPIGEALVRLSNVSIR